MAVSEEHKKKMIEGRKIWLAKKHAERDAIKSVYAPAENSPTEKIDKETLALSNSRLRTVTRINKKLEKIIDAQIDLATGLYYTTEDGKHVYTKKPDGGTGEYLLNQLIGKPKENIEVKTVNLNVDF